MPLTKSEKQLRTNIVRQYRKKGYPLEVARKIANSVVYREKRVREIGARVNA